MTDHFLYTLTNNFDMHDISVTSSHSSSITDLTGIEVGKAPSGSPTEDHQSPQLVTQLIVLNSFLPVVKVLKGLTKEENSGYVSCINLAT